MKRIMMIITLSLLIGTLFGCHQGGGENYTYKAVADGVALYRYKGSTTKTGLIVPDEVDGAKVVELMDFCAANSQYLTTVKIGAHVKIISPWALANCKQLEKITVDAANPYFEADEFGVLFTKGRGELVCYPNARQRLIKDDSGRTTGGGTYEIPASVKRIKSHAFYLCDNLYRITFPEGLEEVGDAAFMKCSSLQNFVLPESLTVIGRDSFSFCDALTAVTIPRNVLKIGDYAFFSQASLIKTITTKKPINRIHRGDDWLPIIKSSGGVKAEVVYSP